MGIATRISGRGWSLALLALAILGGWSAARAAHDDDAKILGEPLCFATTAQDDGAGCQVSPKPKQLDLLLIAEPARINTFATNKDFPPKTEPEAWVYKYCWRPRNGANECPPDHENNLYGGTRLQLEPGDVLKIRLVNHLPPVPDAKHAQDPGGAFLSMNPTNIHTHGMLVEPRFPTSNDPTYGDNVFVMTLNPRNFLPAEPFDPTKPPPVENSHIHGDVRIGYTDYRIEIPKDHPLGLFWLHPHVHGIALNQVSAGLASIITVGDPNEYLFKGDARGERLEAPIRHIILKDAQILADDRLFSQERPDFCGPKPDPLPGYCDGDKTNSSPQDNAPRSIGGRWYFTLNGQQYPTIPVSSPRGEVWRITAASGNVTYKLRLWDKQQKRNLMFQVLAIDGVAVGVDPLPSGATQMAGNPDTINKIQIGETACPEGAAGKADGRAICANWLLMMPGSRAELLVAYRDEKGRLVKPGPEASAIFQTVGFNTGGDDWPAVDLANVTFSGPGPNPGMAQTVAVQGWSPDQQSYIAGFAAKSQYPEDSCPPLAKGHYRRIFFGAPDASPNGFGLGYEEVDENDKPVSPQAKVSAFDPDNPTICVPRGTEERWQLVNLTGEDHNFHIHQVRFKLMATDTGTGKVVLPNGQAVLHDNYPLLHADGACSVETFDNGNCKDNVHPVNVSIQFKIAGDFVYHCHILEHEDGGMMARIRVRPLSTVGQAPAK